MASLGERRVSFEDNSQPVQILKQLNLQRSSSRFCDVILKVCNEQFYAHSNVLAGASPYFGSFLGQGQDLPRAFSQKTPQIIEIHIDGSDGDQGYDEAVKRVVDFMYTSNIEISYDVLTPVIEIAKIMQMEKILEFCDRFQKGEDSRLDAGKVHTSTQTNETYVQIPQSKLSYTTLHSSNLGTSSSKSKLNPVLKSIDDEVLEISQKACVTQTTYSKKKKGRGRPRKKLILTSVNDNDKKIFATITDCGNEDDKQDYSSDNQNELEMQSESISTDYSSRSNRKRKLTVKMKALKCSKKEPIEQEDPAITSVNVVLECDFCPYTTDNPYHYNRHRQAHTDSNRKYRCEMCDFTSAKLRTMLNHKRDHLHAKNECSMCDYQGEDSASLEKHFEQHKGPFPFFCTVCDLRFKTRTKLNLHLPKHSADKPFVCKICDTGFKWKHALKNHMITHSDSKDHLCDVCGFATAHKSQLKAHKLIHTGETFKCTDPGCKFQATKKQNLKYHMLTHTHEKPHQCEVCGQAFSLVKNMKRHMLLHTDERPYKCKQCRFSTTRYDKLKEHMLKQHGQGDSPKRRHRLSDYPKSLVPDEKDLSYKVEEVSNSNMIATLQNLSVHVENQMRSEKPESNVSGSTNDNQMFTIQQHDQPFPITLTRITSGTPEVTYQLVTQVE